MRPLVPLLLVAAACAAPQRFEQSRVLMGTRGRIALYARDDAAARAAFDAAFARLEQLEAALSDWREDSELSRLCAAPYGQPHPVGPDLYGVLDRALATAARTDGAFDPTLGPLTRLWRESREAGALPSEEARAAARERTGWRHVRLDPHARTVRLDRPGMRLDLGGIAKGYAADETVALLSRRGAPRCLVDLGGDVAIGDAPPGAAGWEIRVGEEPVLLLRRCGIAASGDTARFLEVGGVRYSHLVDPRTGLGLTHGMRVTVVAPTTTEADALATALAVMGRDGSLLFLRDRRDLRVYFDEARFVVPPREGPAGPWREARDGEVASVEEGHVILRIHGNVLPRPGTRFLVWRTAAGLLRQEVAVVEVVAAGLYEVTARVVEEPPPGIPLAAGMSVSSPFFDGFGRPRVYVDDAVTFPRGTLEERLSRAGGRLVPTLDAGADAVVVPDAVAAMADTGARRDALTPDAPDVVRRAIDAGAVLVPESLMQRLLGD